MRNREKADRCHLESKKCGSVKQNQSQKMDR